jgi:predicted dehydrogenase
MMKLKHIVASGIIGEIVHAQVDSFWWRGSHYYDLWWRGTWEKEGGGCVLNHAVHHIDLFHWIVGMPQAVQALVANLAHDNSEVEDFATSVLFYANKSIGQINVSLVHHGEPQQLVVQGERARVGVPWQVYASRQRENGFPERDVALEHQIQAHYEQLPNLTYEMHAGQIANVLAAIEGTEELLVDGVAGRNTIELVTAIYASSFTNARVTLPLTPEHPFYTRDGILQHAPRFYEKTYSVADFADNTIIVGAISDQKTGGSKISSDEHTAKNEFFPTDGKKD